jgi:hypothetical protein
MIRDFALKIQELTKKICIFYNKQCYIDIDNPDILAVYKTENYKLIIEYDVKNETGHLFIETNEKVNVKVEDGTEFSYYKTAEIQLDDYRFRKFLYAFITNNLEEVKAFLDDEDYRILENFMKEVEKHEVSRQGE